MALNLGGLFFTLDADTRGLMNAQRRVERFANEVRNAFRGVSRGTVAPEFAQQLARQERAVIAAMERIKRAQNSVATANLTPRGAREAQVTLERLGMAYENFVRKMARPVALNTLDFGRRVQHMNSQIVDATRNIQRLTKESKQGTDILHGFGSAALLVQGHLGGMSTRFFALTTLVKDFGLGIAIAAGSVAALATGFGVLATGSIKAGMALQQVEKQLTAVSGNAAIAQYHIKFVKDVADQAGIAFNDTAKGFARFLVSAKSGGLTLQQTQEAFRGIALAGATMQLTTEDMQGVFRALDQMMSKGSVQAEELRGQLGDRLPGAFIAAAAAMKVSTAELNKMLKAGEVMAADFVPKFVRAYMTMVGIDPAAPIRTLQAELTRAGNNWTYFLQAMNRATNLTGTMQAAFENLNKFLVSLTSNLHIIIPAIGGVIGALTGLAVAMALPTVIAYVSAWGTAITAFYNATRALRLLTVAQIALNAAMTFFQNLPIVRIFTMLALAIGGAYLGYKLFDSMVQKNNDSVGQSLGFWESYIAQQKRAGVQIRAVTVDIINQARALAMQQMNLVESTRSQMRSAASGPGVMDWMQSLQGARMGAGWTNPADLAKARAGQLAGKLIQESNELNRMTKVLNGLSEVATLPELNEGANNMAGLGKAAKGAKESVEGITNRIKDLIDAARIASQQLQAMTVPLREGEDIRERMADLEDLGQALRIVNNLSPKELGTAAGLLGVPADVNAVTQAIKGLVGETRRAEDSVKRFVDVISSLQQGQRQFASLAQQMKELTEFGTEFDPMQMKFLEEIGKATETLANLDQGTIAAISRELTAAGYGGKDAAEQLANFNTHLTQTGDQVKALEDFLTKMRELKFELRDIQTLNAGMGTVGGLDQIFGGDIAEAFDRAVDRGRQVRQMAETWRALGESQETINERTATWLNLLRQLDEAKFVNGQMAAEVSRTQGAFRDMITAGVTGLRDMLRGVDSLSDGIMKLAERILDIAFENWVMAPIQDWVSSIGRQRGEAAAAGVDAQVAQLAATAVENLGSAAQGSASTMQGQLIQSISGLVGQQVIQQVGTQALTTAIAQLAASAVACSAALNALAASAGGGEGGEGGGSGIVGALGNVVGALFGGSGGQAGIANGVSQLISGGGTSGLGTIGLPGRGVTGPVSAGKMYRINEPGVQDYFIPSVNGYMTPDAPSRGMSSIRIDARTTIDARGATEDVIATLRTEMAARDARLRAELPYHIDARTRDNRQRLRQ